jgi:hypothetical protein
VTYKNSLKFIPIGPITQKYDIYVSTGTDFQCLLCSLDSVLNVEAHNFQNCLDYDKNVKEAGEREML